MSKEKECLQQQTREKVAKVYDFLKQDALEIMEIASDPAYNTEPEILLSKLSKHVNNVRKRTAQAMGTSERTVTTILAERRNGLGHKAPYKNRKKREKKLELNDFTIEVIRTTIDDYQTKHDKFPSLVLLKKIFKKKLNFSGCLTTLSTVLMELGYERGKPKMLKRKEPVEEAVDAVAQSCASKTTSFKNFLTSNALNVTPSL